MYNAAQSNMYMSAPANLSIATGWPAQERAATPTPAPECLSGILQKELAMFANSCKGYLDPSDPSMITAADRMELVDWCYHIVDNCQYPRDTVVMAMAMVDAFLSTPSPTADAARASDVALYSQNKFQLLTIAALYCSIKAKSNVDVPAGLFAHKMCGGLHTKEEIETMVCTLLGGSSSWMFAPASTAYEFGRTVLSSLVPYTNLPEATWSFLLGEVQYQTEHAVRDYYFSTQRTSTIALAAIFNAVKRLSCNAQQEMLVSALTCIVEHFDFDDSKLIFIAQQRLQGLLDGKVAHPKKDPNLDDSMKSLVLSDTDFNDLINSFETDFDKTMPMPSEDHDVDAPPLVVTSARPMNPTPPKPTIPHLSVAPIPTVITTTPSRPAATEGKTPTKPLRPLSAYQIFLQIEKEFIIQTMDGGEDTTDKSNIEEDKVYLDYVPERYRQIKLSPEWYFGPGKRRKKRRHRKGHGKIGFLELSRTIASRWSKLDETNPEVKNFVQKIADQEHAEYRREMKVYNMYIKHNDLSTPLSSASSTTTKAKETKKRKQEHGSEQSSQEEGAAQVSSTPSSEYRRITLECCDREEDGPPCVITPSTSTSLLSTTESADELGPFILGNDLNGFSYLPATKY